MFQLNFEVPISSKKINLKDPILLIGSCFSNEIGTKLAQSKFNELSNPFGTIYNPYSIFKLLKNEVDDNRIIESQGVFYHWGTHGSISGLSKTETRKLFNQKNQETQAFLKKAKWLVITLGTAIVYEHKQAGIVANCHKIPSSHFQKRFLGQKEIMDQFASLHTRLNPNLNILFTVSPVRHIRDGLVENNRSKAILIDSIHQLVRDYENVHYFPSYEILIDQLRDYRFYAEDMVHPSPQATGYIWGRFGEAYFDAESKTFVKEWEKLRSALDHRPFHPGSPRHQQFLKATLRQLEKWNEKVDMRVEREQIKKQIL